MSGVISIQGNLGAGKSTLLSLFNFSVIKEPVDEWEKMAGGNILKNYYEDPKRWAFTFQLNALHSRALLWNKAISAEPEQLHFSERSPSADRHVFGQIMYRQGNMEPAQYEIYDQICDKLVKECPLRAIIYLRCSPDLCLERIKQRNRQGEEGIPLDYLRKVHERQEDWLKSLEKTPILTIDTGIYDIYDPSEQEVVKTLIKNFIQELYASEKRTPNSNIINQLSTKETVEVEA